MRTQTISARRGARLSFGGVLAASGIALAAVFAAAAPAAAHDELIDTRLVTAESGEVTAFTLTYSNEIVKIGTEVHVTDAQGADVSQGEPEVSGRDVTQQLVTPVSDGRYDAVWRVVSSDGHPIEGGFSFEVTDGTAGEILPLSDDFDGAAAPTDDSADSGDTGDSHGEHSHDEAPSSSGWVVPVITAAVVVVVGGAIAALVVAKRRRN